MSRIRPATALAATGALAISLAWAATSSAVQAPLASVVSTVPAANTPQVNDGRVYSIADVSGTVVVGGTFTSVSKGGVTYPRTGVFAFNKATNQVVTAFNPTLDGTEVQVVLPGPIANTVYVGGDFLNVNGVKNKYLTLLDVRTGQPVVGFKPQFSGEVDDLVLRGNRLFVAGTFGLVSSIAHKGLATINPTTGALDPFMNVQLSGHHNNSGSGAQASIGATAIDVTPDASRMVVVGNFTKADDSDRQQIAVVDLTGSAAAVRADWNTNRYSPLCYSWAFDSYMRDVDMAPDGSWFTVVTTGGGNPGTLCDAAARFETNATGTDLNPTWASYAGGDSIFSVAVTPAAVYIGSHGRWMNNPSGVDSPGPGAVPRPGLAALDPRTGVPLSWNPGRTPRGFGATAALATPDGLWMGSDTEYIGNRAYFRPRLAFFPLAGGQAPVPESTGAGVPGNVFAAATSTGGTTNVLYRVNAGGPAVPAIDNGPDWAADTSDPSPFRNSGSNTAGFSPATSLDQTVPAGTPSALFDDERWDPGSKGDGGEMSWSFPVTAGKTVDVRLYLANRYSGTSGVGQRVFDVDVEGKPFLQNFDIVAAAGDQTGTMRSTTVTSDGTITISFDHEVENPLVDGIEIVDPSVVPAPPSPAGLVQRTVTTTGTTAEQAAPDGGLDWRTVRAATRIGTDVWYAKSDGTFDRRTFDGTTWGPERAVDPYNDPAWSDVQTGSGQTYRGTRPSFYGELQSLTGLAYDSGRLFYTRAGSTALYYRMFSPDSGVVSAEEYTAAAVLPAGSPIAISNHQLLYEDANGNLLQVGWNGSTVTGNPVTVSGPSADGYSWAGRAMFLA